MLPQTKFVLIYFLSLQHSQQMEVFLNCTLTTTAMTSHSHSNHTSPQGNHPLLVGPLLIEIRLKSAFWRKLQPLYCSSVFLKRKTWISINNGPTNRGWSACDKPLSCLTLVQFSQSCILTDFKQNKIMKNAPQINTVSMVFHCNMSKDKKGKINRKGSILMIKSSPRWRRCMCVCGGGGGGGWG